MVNTYSWKIGQMDVSSTPVDGHDDCVVTVHYWVHGTDTFRTAEVQWAEGITYNPSAEYIPFANLTEVIVIKWVQDQIGEEGVANACLQIDALLKQMETEVIPKSNPWSS
jgi:hypothetical protein